MGDGGIIKTEGTFIPEPLLGEDMPRDTPQALRTVM